MQSSRIQVLDPMTSEHHGSLIVVVAAIGLFCSILTLLIRIYAKYKRWEWDDSCLAAGTAIALCQTVLCFAAVNQGYGARYSLHKKDLRPSAAKELYAGNILYVAAISASKLSTCLLLMRVTRRASGTRAVQLALFFTALWTFASIFVVALRPPFSSPWILQDGQSAMFSRWLSVEIPSMLLEVAIFGICSHLAYKLRVTKTKKLIMIITFALRLPIIALTCVRLFYLAPTKAGDPWYSGVAATLLTQAVMHYSLCAATFPCLKQTFQPFTSTYEEETENILERGLKSTPKIQPLATESSTTSEGAESYLVSAEELFYDGTGLGPSRGPRSGYFMS